jgi:hypothetical protein
MSNIATFAAVFIAGSAAVYLAMVGRGLRLKRESYIRHYVFPSSLLQSLKKSYPQLEDKDQFLTARALRQYFLAHLRARNRRVGMPSKVVDALWHDFILDTKTYQVFCRNAFGAFFHHIPSGKAMPKGASRDAMRLTWHLACLEENIDPKKATRLPLLFAIDSKLQIPDGNVYNLNALREPPQQGSGGTCGGFGCSGGDSSCSGGCSGGCGGGCGGD